MSELKIWVEPMAYLDRFCVNVGDVAICTRYDGKPTKAPVTFTFKADAQKAAYIAEEAVKMAMSTQSNRWLEWEGHDLRYNGREIGEIYETERGWRYFLMQESPSSTFATPDEARQALWDAAVAWLSPLRDKTGRTSETAENEGQGEAQAVTIRGEPASGITLKEMRAMISPTLRATGDLKLMWVNEGDWIGHRLTHARQALGAET